MSEEKEVVVSTEIAPKTDKENENSTVIDFKMVTFSLADRDYSIDIMHVKEIAKASRFTFVPNTLPFVLGVYNLRGEIIPILDLRLFFNIEVPEHDDNKLENMLILTVDDQKFGVVVDKIDKVIGVQKSTIQPPHPLFGDINIKYIDGVVESNNRLYVLLDITKIFSSKEVAESHSANHYPVKPAVTEAVKAPAANGGLKAAATAAAQKAPEASTVPKEPEIDLKFVKESLQNYSKFYLSPVNESWVKHRYTEWSDKGKKQIQNEAESKQFLENFWSTCTDSWWTKEFASSVEKVLPDNSAKQIIVWNPGCGKGMETYSLACVLKKRYPDSKIRIYAQDIDLLSVSNAALMSIPAKLATDWYGSYLTKKANGEYTFSQEIKDSIMFEYHDCKNANALPMVDIIFARDILSLLDEKSQEAVAADFLEKMKGNGIAIIGENETMPSSLNFAEKTVGTLVAYSKD
ncbi:MAG: chemotaxis protein CheW [Treponema sp.]|nr:chemotaxis protein CheW [Treponema sp.]